MRLRNKLLVAGIVVAGLIVAPAASFFAIYSADAPPPDDADLRAVTPKVPPEENGFPLIHRAAKAVFWLKGNQWLDGQPPEGADEDALTDGRRLDRMDDGEAWDDRLAAGVLQRNREALALFEEGMARPHFQLPRITSIDDPALYPFGLIQLGRLLMLRSRAQARAGQAEDAIETAFRLLRFGDRLERGNNSLIACLVARTLQRMGLDLVHDHLAEASLPPGGCWHVFSVVIPSERSESRNLVLSPFPRPDSSAPPIQVRTGQAGPQNDINAEHSHYFYRFQ